MGTFLVEGGHRLDGRIRPAGNKNAALPCLAATVLASEPVTLENVPRIRDVETFLKIIESLGADVRWSASNEVTIDAAGTLRDSGGMYRFDFARCGTLRLYPRGSSM